MNGHGAAVSVDPFTPEGVFALLRDHVVKGNATLPKSTGPAIADLTRALNLLQHLAQGWTGPWREEEDRCQGIAEAIGVLTEVLPPMRNDYVAIIDGFEHWGMIDAAAKARAQLTIFDSLVTAARDAKEKLPLGFNPTSNLGRPIQHWKDFAESLQAIFHSILPGQSKDAGYRFIVAVTPTITGEEPTFEAVKTAFKKNRLVNRDMRKS